MLVLGLTFKENCPDLRNTRVIDVIDELKEYGLTVDVHDPWADADCAELEYGIHLTPAPQDGQFDAIVLAVAHRQFKSEASEYFHGLGKEKHIIFDIKYILPAEQTDNRL